jgi:hypothetical protein
MYRYFDTSRAAPPDLETQCLSGFQISPHPYRTTRMRPEINFSISSLRIKTTRAGFAPALVVLPVAPYVVARGFTQIEVAGTTLGTVPLILQSGSESDAGVQAGRFGLICCVSFSVPVSM